MTVCLVPRCKGSPVGRTGWGWEARCPEHAMQFAREMLELAQERVDALLEKVDQGSLL